MKVQTLIALLILLIFGCQSSEQNQPEQTAMDTDIVSAMDTYHRVLRPLMHQALPAEDAAAFKEGAQTLLGHAEAISTAPIPEKLEGEKDRINELTGSLLVKTRTFAETCETGSDEEIFDTFSVAHDEYEALADIVYDMKHQ